MSLDYPDRAKWLAVRSTPKRFPAKIIHVSARILTIREEGGGFKNIVEKPGHTYRRRDK